MYWKYFLIFVAAQFVCLILFSFVVVATLAPLAISVKSQSVARILAMPVMIASGLAQVYFWGFWVAFCSGFATKYATMPTVSYRWLYYVTAFFFCTGPLGYLSHKESQTAQSSLEQRGIARGTLLYSLVAIAAFFVFRVWPGLVEWPYGWALHYVL